jgi:PAS domain S-box-containing protein
MSGTEERYRAIFESAVDFAMIATDREGRVTDWNRGAERVLGWSAEEMRGEPVDAFFTPEDRAIGRPEIEMRLAREEGRAADERWHLRKDGSRFWASGEMMPLRDGRGGHLGYLKILRDRTREHRAGEALRDAEARLRRAQEAGGVGLFTVTLADGLLHPTPEFCRLFGLPVRESYPAGEVEARILPEDRGTLGPDLALRPEGEPPAETEHRIRRADTGEVRWIARRAEVERDASGTPLRVVGVARDITAEVAAREEVAAERDWLLRAFNQAPGFVAMLEGPEHRFTFANAAYGQLIGGREVLGRTVREALPELEGQGFFELLDQVYASGEPFRGTSAPVRLARQAGEAPEERILDFVYQPVTDAEGRVKGLVVEGSDVTEHHRTQARILEVQRRLDAVLNNASVAIFLMDERQHCAYMNRAAEELTGYSFAETQGRPLHDVIHHTHPDGRPFPLEDCAIDRAFPENADTRGEEVFVHKDGSFYPVAFVASPIRDEASRTIGTIIEVRDISREKAAQRALEEAQAVAETLNRTGVTVAAELDLGKVVQQVTDAGVELTGAAFGAFFYNVLNETGERLMLYSLSGAERSEFDRFGMPRATAIFHPTFAGEGVVRSDDILADPRYGRNAPYKGMPEGHLPVRSYLAVPVASRSGEVMGGLFFGHPEPGRFAERHERILVGLAAQASIAIDNARLFRAVQQANETLEARVAERTGELMHAQEALQQAQKMEAVGQLTGGIAHDFNNLLAGISGSLELLASRLSQGRVQDVERYLTAAQSAARRAAALTHRLLAFSRRQTLDPKPTNVNRLVTGMEELIRRTVGPAIAVETIGAAGLWTTLVDAPQLESALLNLCINARDAMPDGGRITIETANKWLDRAAARQHDMPEGQYLSLCVTDTGTGMSPEVKARAFDPFFTTKPIGQGTGLGLSMIYGFARQSGGQVRIYSEEGQGTTVCIYLPRHHGADEAEDEEAAGPELPRSDQGETVLVVDDEPTVRMLVTDVLEELGYSAIEAADSATGLKILQSDARIDLLVTDVGLPGGMNGRQMADAARVARPGLRVLFITGYADNAAVGNGHLDPGMSVLTKPFPMEALATRIREMIRS